MGLTAGMNSLTNTNTENIDNSQTVGTGTSAAQGNAISNNLATTSGAITINQESPEAIAALNGVANEALLQSTAQVAAIGTMARGLTEKALETAKEALTPSDSRLQTTITILAIAAVAIFILGRK